LEGEISTLKGGDDAAATSTGPDGADGGDGGDSDGGDTGAADAAAY